MKAKLIELAGSLFTDKFLERLGILQRGGIVKRSWYERNIKNFEEDGHEHVIPVGRLQSDPRNYVCPVDRDYTIVVKDEEDE